MIHFFAMFVFKFQRFNYQLQFDFARETKVVPSHQISLNRFNNSAICATTASLSCSVVVGTAFTASNSSKLTAITRSSTAARVARDARWRRIESVRICNVNLRSESPISTTLSGAALASVWCARAPLQCHRVD
jgi:hypothetical protein